VQGCGKAVDKFLQVQKTYAHVDTISGSLLSPDYVDGRHINVDESRENISNTPFLWIKSENCG
jgi:hypothetical protein